MIFLKIDISPFNIRGCGDDNFSVKKRRCNYLSEMGNQMKIHGEKARYKGASMESTILNKLDCPIKHGGKEPIGVAFFCNTGYCSILPDCPKRKLFEEFDISLWDTTTQQSILAQSINHFK